MCIRLQQNRWGDEYDGTLKKTKTDAQGRELYPDSSANMHSTGASGSQQDGMKIDYSGDRTNTGGGGSSGGGLKGDEPLTDNSGSQGGGSTDDINY